MAVITGTSTIDWSGVPLEPTFNLEETFDDFFSRLDQVITEVENDQFFLNSTPTSTFISVTLFSGGRLSFAGSGLLGNFPIVTSASYSNPFTGDLFSFVGTLDFVGAEVLNKLTIGVPGLRMSLIGNIVNDELGNTSGSITQLQQTLGSTTLTVKGNLSLSVSDEISGTVTDISVVSGTNTIVMSGLSLDYSALDSVTTADELLSVVGSQMSGNDTITYTNNSAVGMTFSGGAGNDTITISGPNADTLNGGDGNDILIGGLGQDAVNGEAGDDRVTMLVSAGNVDTIDAGADNDTLVLTGVVSGDHVVVVDLSSGTDQVVSIGGAADPLTQINFENVNAVAIGSSATIIGSNGDNTIIGSNGNDVLLGGAGTDLLSGGLGNDSLDGGAGNDALSGGVGNDTYIVDSAGDTVTEGLNAGADKVFSSIDYALTPNVENLELTGSASLNGTGNVLNNRLTGNNGINILTGMAGNDTYIVQNDADSVVENLNAGTDVVQSAAANFTLGPNVEHLTLIGSADSTGTGNTLNNILTGNSGDNTLSGEAGNDQLIGGEGDDTLLGGLGNDTLLGGTGADQLDGGAGTDNMAGGTGNDTYTVDGTTDVVAEAVNAGTDTVLASINYTLGTNVENLTLTGAALTGTGNVLANVLTGNAGNNVLNGGVGNDTLLGGDGNDTYVIGLGTDVLTENLNEGTDTVQSTITHTLGANFENLTLTGVGAINGTGNALANVITGNAAANVLAGEAGNDTLLGGAGNDRVVMQMTSGNVDVADGGTGLDTLALVGTVDGDGVVVVDLSSLTDQVTRIGTVNPESLVQKNFENLDASGLGSSVQVTGSAGANVLIGSNGIDTLMGMAGNDILDGGAGDDALDGGIGNDVLLIGTATDHGAGETLTGGLGTDVIRFTSTTTGQTLTLAAGVTAVESLVIGTATGLTTGTTALNVNASNVVTGLSITGNAGDNVLTGTNANDTVNGGAGNDTLNGGLGTNTLIGGTGNDTFFVNATTDVVSEGLNAGIDTVEASLNYTLTANVENLELTGSALTGTGNTLANVLTGNNGSNVLNGGAGNDTLIGGLGEDTVTGGTENDRVVMQMTSGNVDVADGGTGLDTLALVGTVDGDGVVVVDLSSLTDQVTRIGTVNPESLVQKNFENLDASGLGSSVQVTGSAGANVLIGSAGADTLSGRAGTDTLDGGADDDTLTGGDGNDVILIGDAADHDAEVIDGGAGTDVIRFTSTTEGQTLVLGVGVTEVESVVIGTAAGLTTGTTGLGVNASNVATGLSITGNAGDNVLTGTNANDTLNAGAGNDLLIGGAGTNTLLGGTGNDLYIVDAATDLVIEGLNAGTDTVEASLNYTLTANVENLVLRTGTGLTGTGNTLANGLTGFGGANTLSGLAGNDTLIGGAGQDTVDGGVGNDTIVMHVSVGDVDVADGGTGTDTLTLVGLAGGDGVVTVNLASLTDQVTEIGSSDLDTLIQKNFENLNASELIGTVQATGSAGANLLIGSSGADQLVGMAGNDTLDGGTGGDAMDGGAGNDIYVVESLGDTVTETLAGAAGGTDVVQSAAAIFTLGPNVEHLTLIGSADSTGTGNALNNILTGNSGDNTLSGEAGNDQLIGGEGDDTLLGGLGNDMLLGGTGADQLDGGAGTDNMAGGIGNDTYTVDVAADVVTEALNAGTDTVVASLNYTLGTNVENLTLTGTALTGTGNTLANVLTGNAGNNVLNGGVGNDTLLGSDGNDTYVIGLGTDVLTENLNEGTDTVQSTITHTLGANFENLTLTGGGPINGTGNELANVLTGNAAANVLAGEAGNDTLLGGAGNDTYLFGLGNGQDLVQDNSGAADKMLFDGGVNPLDLVISRQTNDLRIAIHGSSDQITVQNWYTNPANRTETIQAGNGQTLLSTQVDQLIQAMAGFTTQTGLTWDQGIDQQPQTVQAILAANWQ